MLAGHPHVTRMRIAELVVNGRARRTLVVESPLAQTKTSPDYLALDQYLQELAGSDFMEFDHYSIEPISAAASPRHQEAA